MHGRQISVCCADSKLGISKTITREIINNHLGTNKICMRQVPKLLTRIRRMNRVECCQELQQKSEANPVKFFSHMIIGAESWVYHYDRLIQLEVKIWKRSDKTTPI